jgi:hypothetical protein
MTLPGCPYHKLHPDIRMVQTTEVGYGSDPAFPCDWPSQRRIFVQRQMGAGTIVIVGIGAEGGVRLMRAGLQKREAGDLRPPVYATRPGQRSGSA